MEVFYQVVEWGHCDEPQDWLDCDTTWVNSWEGIAEDCAENAFHEHDGWEASWPLTIRVYDAPTKEGFRGEFEVDCEPLPQFYARNKEPQP